MRKVLRGAVLLTALFASAVSAQVRDLVGVAFDAHVVSIVDGDTVDVVLEGQTRRVRIRLEGIDAPERGEPFSTAAARSARVLLFDQRARVEGRDVDRYGRLVARISARGTDASVELITAGLACHYTQYSSDARLASAEAEARRAGRGLWAAGAARPDCATASGPSAAPRASGPPETTFHGNVVSHVYHAPSCRNYNCRNCTRTFQSETEAHASGFRPAGDCLRAGATPVDRR
jgi:endonuclease YncB( thermonuclease family)